MMHALLLFVASAIYSQVDAQPTTSSAQACSKHHCKPTTEADCKSEADCKVCDSCPKPIAAKCTADCKHTADRVLLAANEPAAVQPVCCKRTADRELLDAKLAELDRLQHEVDQLRQTTGIAQQILVRIKVLEVPTSKVCKLAESYSDHGHRDAIPPCADAIGADTRKSGATLKIWALDQSQNVEQLLEQLPGKVLAEPSILTLSGRPATFHVGGVLPLPAPTDSSSPVDFQKFGTEVDLLVVSVANNNIRLDARIVVSEPDYARTVSIRGTDVPLINKRLVDTSFELASGKSGIVSFAAPQRSCLAEKDCRGCSEQNEGEEVQLLFIVTPELEHFRDWCSDPH